MSDASTAVEPAASTGVDVPGLEDFETTDMAMPRISIDHGEAKFVDSLSGEKSDTLTVVLLGLVKQRILWPAEVSEEKSSPLCKSNDFVHGSPNPATFPWDASGMSADDYDTDEPHTACANCQLKEWDSNPKNGTPWCSEQYTFPLLTPVTNEDGTPGFAPAVFTVQRSAIKPCKQYLTSFSRSRTPLYTCQTKITLEARRRGSVNYAVPQLVKDAETDQDLWPRFANQYREMRDFLQTSSSTGTGDGEGATSDAPGTPPAAAATSSAPADDDDLPF